MSTRERGERGDLNYVFHKVGKCGESKFKFEKILVENFLSVEPGSGHKAKIFGISGNMFFSRIGPFRIVWRKKNFFVNILAGRHEIVPPEPSSSSNISGS